MNAHKVQVRLSAIPQHDSEIVIDGVKLSGCTQKIMIVAEVGGVTRVELDLVGVAIDLIADAAVRAKILDLADDKN